MLTLSVVIILGWLSASIIGTWAYFAGNPESGLSLPKFVSKR